MRFNKPAYTPTEHVKLLKANELIITDSPRAIRYLSTIGYYRLSAYFKPFLIDHKHFKPGTTFDKILSLYIFDRKLRLHVIDAIERIEVGVRAILSDTLSNYYDPHWYTNKQIFKNSFLIPSSTTHKSEYDIFIKKIILQTGKNNPAYQNPSCKHYYETYTSPELPPSWIIAEVLTMGTWSVVYKNISKGKIRQKVSNFFHIKTNDFAGWLHALTLIRNCCAHHNRFWNNTFPPKAKNVAKYTHPNIPLNTPYANLAIIQSFLTSFTNKPTWSNKLHTILSDCPLSTKCHMKFPEKWELLPFWRISQCPPTSKR